LPFARALYKSLEQFNKRVILHVLVVDDFKSHEVQSIPASFKVHKLSDLKSYSSIGHQILEKYNNPEQLDQLRWSLKPIFINYLFNQGYEKVVFTDPDTFYFSDYTFLFNELDDNSILLTPHWRGVSPEKNEANFNLQFVGGLYNAGFIGVHKRAKAVMDWWAEMCLYKCEKDFENGHYVDQTYLNLMPVYFDKVKILKHQGCNVANWNQQVCKRSEIDDRVVINDIWELVFIHFTTSTIRGILYQGDSSLKPHLEEYMSALEKSGIELIPERYKPNHVIGSSKLKRSTYWRAKNWLNKKIKGI
jgi:hypothetical protein